MAFHCRIVDGHEVLSQALEHYRNYYNLRVRNERDWREAKAAAAREMVPGWEALELETAEADALVKSLEQKRKQLSSRLAYAKKQRNPTAQLKTELDEIKAQRDAARATLKELRERKEALQPEYDRCIGEPSRRLTEEARSRSLITTKDGKAQVHGATFSKQEPLVFAEMVAEGSVHPAWVALYERNLAAKDVERAARRAGPTTTMTLAYDAFSQAKAAAKFGPPKFCNGGRVGVEASPPIPVSRMFAGMARDFRMAEQADPGKRLRGKKAIVPATLVVDGKEIRLSVLQHRPIPDDAQFCRATIVEKRTGHRVRHELQLTLEAKSFEREPTGTGTVAVNLAWRHVPGKERVWRAGHCVDDEGGQKEINLPQDIVDRLAEVDRLKSDRDRLFAAFLPEAVSLIRALPDILPKTERDRINEQLSRKAAALGKVKLSVLASLPHMSAQRFSGLTSALGRHHLGDDRRKEFWDEWRRERIGNGLDLFDDSRQVCLEWCIRRGLDAAQAAVFWFDTWRRKHQHIDQWACDLGEKARARRKDFYRNVTRLLANVYGEVVVCDTNISLLAQKKGATDEEKAITSAAQGHRVIVAPSELKAELAQAFGKNHMKTVPAAGITSKHAGCGGTITRQGIGDPAGVCSKCTTVVDLDVNACLNQLHRASGAEDLEVDTAAE